MSWIVALAPPSRTRCPANAAVASGTARMTSAPAAIDAHAPPVVGPMRMATCGTPAAASTWLAAAMRCICTRAFMPSCMRQPPEECSETTGRPAAAARRKALAIFSPPASLIEPPMKAKSNATSTARVAPTRPSALTTDSSSPERSRARVSCAS